MEKGEEERRRPKGPLEHLVADPVVNMILFLNLIQQEIFNSRKMITVGEIKTVFLLYHLFQ